MSKMAKMTGKITIELTTECPEWARDEDDYRAHMHAWCENDPLDFFQQFASCEPKVASINDVRKVE